MTLKIKNVVIAIFKFSETFSIWCNENTIPQTFNWYISFNSSTIKLRRIEFAIGQFCSGGHFPEEAELAAR